jgi:hypothetical protein
MAEPNPAATEAAASARPGVGYQPFTLRCQLKSAAVQRSCCVVRAVSASAQHAGQQMQVFDEVSDVAVRPRWRQSRVTALEAQRCLPDHRGGVRSALLVSVAAPSNYRSPGISDSRIFGGEQTQGSGSQKMWRAPSTNGCSERGTRIGMRCLPDHTGDETGSVYGVHRPVVLNGGIGFRNRHRDGEDALVVGGCDAVWVGAVW